MGVVWADVPKCGVKSKGVSLLQTKQTRNNYLASPPEDDQTEQFPDAAEENASASGHTDQQGMSLAEALPFAVAAAKAKVAAVKLGAKYPGVKFLGQNGAAGLVGNMATGLMSTVVSQVGLGEVGCVFGLGCSDKGVSNEDIKNEVAQQADRIVKKIDTKIDEQTVELKDAIKEMQRGVEATMLAVRDDLTTKMATMERSLNRNMDAGFKTLTQELYREVDEVTTQIRAARQELSSLAKKNNFESAFGLCESSISTIENWYVMFHSKQLEIKNRFAGGGNIADRKHDVEKVWTNFMEEATNEPSRIKEEMHKLQRCIVSNRRNLFTKFAQQMNHDNVDGGEKIVKLADLLQYYMAAFYKADTVLMARLGYDEMRYRNPSIVHLVSVAAEYQFRRSQVYKGFWDALHGDLFANSCPSCTPTASQWCGGHRCEFKIMANHRSNSHKCRQTDAVGEAYTLVKQLWGATPSVTAWAKQVPDLDLRSWGSWSRLSHRDSLCGIYRTTAANQVNCRRQRPQTQYYTNHRYKKKFVCRTSYVRPGASPFDSPFHGFHR